MSKGARKRICATVVKNVIIPTHGFSIIVPKNKRNNLSHDFVRFVVPEEKKTSAKNGSEASYLFINDHRKATVLAAHSARRMRNGSRNILAEVVRSPAFVSIIELETKKNGAVTLVNLFDPEGKKASGLFVIFTALLAEEKLSLDKIVKYEPLWWWGGRKYTSFGPSGDTLPVAAVTSEDKKVVFHCRKSGDIVTLGNEVKRW